MNEKYKKHYLKYKNKYYNLQKKKLQGGSYTTALLIPLLIIIALSIAGYIYRPNILKMFEDYKTRQEIENVNSSRNSVSDNTLTPIYRKTSSEGKKEPVLRQDREPGDKAAEQVQSELRQDLEPGDKAAPPAVIGENKKETGEDILLVLSALEHNNKPDLDKKNIEENGEDILLFLIALEHGKTSK